MAYGRVTEEALEQAKIALQNFRSMQPTLNAYVRMLTGRADARVEASVTSNGSTDGKVIYYRPPLSLGKKLMHARMRCDRRDEHNLMTCPACAQREAVLVTMYHEIAHIWFNSFPGIGEADKELTIREAIKELGTEYGARIRERLSTRGGKLGYMEMARYVSPFLPLLLNCLEDARVNRALFQALPGVEIMFDADTARIFRDGVEHMGEFGSWTRTHWRDRPLNAQAMIGVFCLASGYDFSDWLHEFVVRDLADETLVKLTTPLQFANDASIIFRNSFLVLARLRELGYCRDESDPDDDFVPPYREPEPKSEESDDADERETSTVPSDDEEGEPDWDEGDDDYERDWEDDSADEEEGISGGDDPEADADDADGEPDGDSPTDEVPSSGEDEVDGDDDAGGDSSLDGSSGSETGDEESGESPDGEGDGAATAGTGPDAGSSDVPEEGDDSGVSDSGEGGHSASPGDELGSGGGGLDGSYGPDRGDEDGELTYGDPDDSAGDGDGEGDDEPAGPDLPIRPDIPWGTADEVAEEAPEIGGHEEPHSHDGKAPHSHEPTDTEGDAAVVAALAAGEWFEKPSRYVSNIQVHKGDYFIVDRGSDYERSRRRSLVPIVLDPPEIVVAPALQRARVVFAENARGRYERNLTRGRIHGPSMARKIPAQEFDFFQQRRLPGRIEYFVGIGIDASGSTGGGALTLAKQVAFAEAEVLSRLGIKFYMYAHSGSGNRMGGWTLDLYEIKAADEPWNDVTKMRLRHMGSCSANLDGHTIQAYRKLLEKRREKKKILHYYSDGAMPCENGAEERAILREEIERFKRQQLILAGVGIRSNAPAQHGLPTVIVEEQADVIKVVEDLEQWITVR